MMSKAFEFTRNLWLRAQLKAPPFVQRSVMPHLHEAKEIARLLARPYLPVCQLQGQGEGGPLAVTYVGLQFTKPFLKDLLFVEEPEERKAGGIPLWRCRELLGLFPSDIVIVEAAKHLIHRLPRHNAMVFPQLVEHLMDVRGDWQDVRSRFRKTVRSNELRLIRKYGYEYDLSYARRDFQDFYHQMYLPTTADRHGELSSPMSIGMAYQYFRYGHLFRIMRDGEWVSGIVCHPERNVLIADLSGVRKGDAQLIHEGATVALYYAPIHWANQNGYEAVNFLGSGARLRSGLLQHKRKWGTIVRVPLSLHRLVWVGIQHNTPAVSNFLKENPCIVVDEDGKLHGLIVVDDLHNVSPEAKKEWEKRYVTPGLDSLIIRSVSSFANGPVEASMPDLVIPIAPISGLGNGQ